MISVDLINNNSTMILNIIHDLQISKLFVFVLVNPCECNIDYILDIHICLPNLVDCY